MGYLSARYPARNHFKAAINPRTHTPLEFDVDFALLLVIRDTTRYSLFRYLTCFQKLMNGIGEPMGNDAQLTARAPSKLGQIDLVFL